MVEHFDHHRVRLSRTKTGSIAGSLLSLGLSGSRASGERYLHPPQVIVNAKLVESSRIGTINKLQQVAV